MNAKSKKWNELLKGIKEHYKIISDEIDGKKVAYLDIPTHFNIGDILIYKGTEEFFIENKINVIYRSRITKKTLDKNLLSEAEVILFHGGGNFGDIYPQFQNFREKIITKYPEKKIICLPQSIHFDDKKQLKKSAEIFKNHKNCIIYVRDNESYRDALKFTDKVKVMPDMAYALHPLVNQVEIDCEFNKHTFYKILNLVRRDCEYVNNTQKYLMKKSFDWDDIITIQDKWLLTIAKILFEFPIVRNLPLIRKIGFSLFNKLSDQVVFKAINYFNSFDIILTDRLHGMILSTLLGKHIYMSDNVYGKSSRYRECWLSDYPFYLEEKDINSMHK